MVEKPFKVPTSEEAAASGVMRVFGDPMRSRIWGMLIAESPLTPSQIRQRLNQSDTGATRKKQVPYSTVYKYLTDLGSLGLAEVDDQPIKGSTAYRVAEGSAKMYDIAQQAHHQLVEVIRYRPDPSIVRLVNSTSREGLLAIARGFAKLYPEEYHRMLQEDSLITE